MSEKLISLRDWEVLAFLAGIKSLIARPIVPKPEARYVGGWYIAMENKPESCKFYSHQPTDDDMTAYAEGIASYAPYQPGDVLWGRERWAVRNDLPLEMHTKGDVLYLADSMFDDERARHYIKRSPVQMPRWASRITRTVTKAYALRVADINEDELRRLGMAKPDNVDAAHRALFELYWNQDWPPQTHYLDHAGLNEWAWIYEVTE